MRQGVLADIVSFANGKSIKPGGQGVYPVFGANGIIGGSDDSNHEDAIILGRVGAYCGAVEKSDDRFWASDNTIVVKPKENNFSKLYTYYLLKFMDLNKFAGGAAQPLLTQTTLKQVPIRYHDNEGERDRIGLMLSSYDNLIENNNRRIAILEDMAQSLYREWFVKFRYPGHESQTLIDSPLGPIPEGWEVKRLDDFLVLQRGFDLPKKKRNEDGGVPIYAASGINGYHDQVKANGPGVVTGRSGTLGIVNLVQEDYWPLNTSLWVKEFKGCTAYYAYYLLSSIGLERFNSGASVPTLNRNDVHGHQVIAPPNSLIEEFEGIAEKCVSQINVLKRKNKNLEQQRDLLLPKLISGKINLNGS